MACVACRTGRWEAHIWEDGKQVSSTLLLGIPALPVAVQETDVTCLPTAVACFSTTSAHAGLSTEADIIFALCCVSSMLLSLNIPLLHNMFAAAM